MNLMTNVTLLLGMEFSRAWRSGKAAGDAFGSPEQG
jgi:hypothetical protein